MPFELTQGPLEGLVLIRPQVFEDDRGFFLESYKTSDFHEYGIDEEFVQDNHSSSLQNVIRGLHFQRAPYAQGKLVRCVRGRVWDVAVDLRRRSKNFTRWAGIELSDANKTMLYIPPGFAHGFAVLSDEAEVVYKCTNEYASEYDGGIKWDDPSLSIDWPMDSHDAILSEKDRNLPTLSDLGEEFTL